MIKPDFDTVKELANGCGLVPISREVLADTETPVSAYLKVRSGSPYAFLFESVVGGEKIGRYSFLGVAPFLIFRSRGSHIEIEDVKTGEQRVFDGEPIAELRKLLKQYQAADVDGMPRFTGGAVGYVSYDAVRLIERIPESVDDDLDLDDVLLLFFDTLLAFDNVTHKIQLIANVHTEGDLEANYQDAVSRLDDLALVLRQPVDVSLESGTSSCEVTSNTSKERYMEVVDLCKEYIVAGDIFQVVPSQRFSMDVTVDSLAIYRALRTVNPSPYMFHVNLGDHQLVGASPELLVRVEDGEVQVRPIAGTRWRGKTEAEDLALGEDLLADEKERAEHIMLVDLGRNDVGRVSKYDTVRVTEQMVIERYSHVMHIVSNVRGELKEDVDALDALFACYPAGTVSGAPKIRAMEVIDEMEPTRRGPYAGAVGYIDFSGNMDTCIAIRTMVIKEDKAHVQAGGGVVFDSVPENEYQETVNKATALFRAVEIAERGDLI
ncbi:MAG: anthranilate synthase component I [Candidatus Latescibacteria bacterium]|nr:anthranilate synthase component I [Candidatus Latescibacterota bacterium]MBT4139554.1 anthranilate synthase component I [Candidatus Latescibacterota bacterium]